MRLIDADALRQRMYNDAFETDTDMQKWDSGCWIRYKMFENAIDSAPTIEPTLYGYNVEHLALIAAVMAKENVTPEKAVETFRNIGGILQMIMDEQKEIIQKAVEQMMERSEE